MKYKKISNKKSIKLAKPSISFLKLNQRFTANAEANKLLQAIAPEFCDNNKTVKALTAGLLAGFSEAIFAVCPMETIKVKFINDMNRGTVFKLATIKQILIFSSATIPWSYSWLRNDCQTRRFWWSLQGSNGNSTQTGYQSNDAFWSVRNVLGKIKVHISILY